MRSWLNDLYVWERSDNEIKNDNRIKDSNITDTEAVVNKSGNSDVDVNVSVDIDTMPIALAILVQSLVKKEITDEEFEIATKKLFNLSEKYHEARKKKESKVKYFNDNIWRR
ncbi:hypothetical protein [Ferdinandcohnia sp. SAFN-114]|uniref:hypothetical protein n=1 Tax=Ferdinandcohnia sp. SAFN-114 TaxID=3387275 RepID=UPI003F807A11